MGFARSGITLFPIICLGLFLSNSGPTVDVPSTLSFSGRARDIRHITWEELREALVMAKMRTKTSFVPLRLV